jgi:hypothetical protein
VDNYRNYLSRDPSAAGTWTGLLREIDIVSASGS